MFPVELKDPEYSVNDLTASVSEPDSIDKGTFTSLKFDSVNVSLYAIEAEVAEPVGVNTPDAVYWLTEYPNLPAPYKPPDTSSSTPILSLAVDTLPYMLFAPVLVNPLLFVPYLKSK